MFSLKGQASRDLEKANFVTGVSDLVPTLRDTIATELHNLNVACLYQWKTLTIFFHVASWLYLM